MLTSSYLARCSDDLVKLYSNLENDILCDISQRLSKIVQSNKTDKMDSIYYSSKIFSELGGLNKAIQHYVNAYDKESQKMLVSLFDDAMTKNKANDLKFIQSANRNLSENQQQILRNTLKNLQSSAIVSGNKNIEESFKTGNAIKVFSNLSRLTKTIAHTAQNDFVDSCNSAYLKVASGAFSYDEALRQECNKLAEKGITTVSYTDSGKEIHRSIESSVRANIMTGINQLASTQTLENAKQLGIDRFEVSAHLGARPEHASWQGKVYTSDELVSICGLGTATGLCGINCRHSYYPYLGGDTHYSKGELDEMQEPSIEVDGKKITRYEAEQKQRLLERNVRKYKLKADILKSAHLDNTTERIKVGEWQSLTKQWCDKTGLKRDYSREFVGNKDSKQLRGIPVKIANRVIPKTETDATTNAVNLFPRENYTEIGTNVFLSENRKNNATNKQEKLKLDKEITQANILANKGHTVYLVPEMHNRGAKEYDAIVDGFKTELKTVTGNIKTLGREYKNALKQGDNIFIKTSDRSANEIYSKLIGETKTQLINGVKLNENTIIYIWIDNEKQLYKWYLKNIIEKTKK